jgi:hypothetical protein
MLPEHPSFYHQTIFIADFSSPKNFLFFLFAAALRGGWQNSTTRLAWSAIALQVFVLWRLLGANRYPPSGQGPRGLA